MIDALIIAGTRPEIIKLSRLPSAIKRNGLSSHFVCSGQHPDENMSWRFIEELGLSDSAEMLSPVKAKTQGGQMAKLILNVERSILRFRPKLVLVQGDTNTTLASAIAAIRNRVPVAHVEAGLRSYDWRMPEEYNRRMVDHISSLLFAPTRRAMDVLSKEDTKGAAFRTGNTALDAVDHYLPVAESCSRVLETIGFKEYVLATFHRAENVDDPHFLREIMGTLDSMPYPVVIPVHPRTRRRLAENGLTERLEKQSNVKMISPLGYFDFLVAMKNCEFLITDSGGIQEEITASKVRKLAIVVRRSTERLEAVEAGFAILAGVDRKKILDAVQLIEKLSIPSVRTPFGDGQASEKIAAIIEQYLKGELKPNLEIRSFEQESNQEMKESWQVMS